MLKCWRIARVNHETMALLLYDILLGFVLPFYILANSYCRLHKRVNQTAFFSDQRLTRLVTAIIVTFVILWLPVRGAYHCSQVNLSIHLRKAA